MDIQALDIHSLKSLLAMYRQEVAQAAQQKRRKSDLARLRAIVAEIRGLVQRKTQTTRSNRNVSYRSTLRSRVVV